MRFPFCALFLLVGGCSAGHATLDSRFSVDKLLFSDDFRHGDANWSAELEKGGSVVIRDGKMEIDSPGGCSVWFKPELSGPILIEYDATLIKAGGPNDRVSDLNCFWMATDPRSPKNILDIPRSGRFADYNELRCYYVGQGGNTNTTTRFRRYIGSPTTRPILPEHDLADAANLLQPDVKQKIQLIACGSLIQYYGDGKKVFEYIDPQPYTRGWFAVRTTYNHMTVEGLQIHALMPK